MKALPLYLALTLALSACERKGLLVVTPSNGESADLVVRTETAGSRQVSETIDRFARDSSALNDRAVVSALRQLDVEIADLELRIPQVTGAAQTALQKQLADLRAFRETESARFSKLQGIASVDQPPAVDP